MKIIYIDGGKLDCEKFALTAKGITEIKSLHIFRSGKDAVEWIKENAVDAVFLDIELPEINGIDLAKMLYEIDRNIRIFFVTASAQYALEAFEVRALGYIRKPYEEQEIRDALELAARIRPYRKKRIEIETIPDFVIKIDGEVLNIKRPKAEELLALLVDRGDVGLTSKEASVYLWEENDSDEKDNSRFRVTMKRLMDILKEAGIEDIIFTGGRKKYIRKERVTCDLYQILEEDESKINKYNGEYMKRYSWAEYRNGQLTKLSHMYDNKRKIKK